jgi:hypothetical protein
VIVDSRFMYDTVETKLIFWDKVCLKFHHNNDFIKQKFIAIRVVNLPLLRIISLIRIFLASFIQTIDKSQIDLAFRFKDSCTLIS